MKPSEILFVILLSIGAIQGVIYGTILWKKSSLNRVANRFLATILFFFSYRLLVEILKLFGLGYYDTWYHILLEYNWVYGALIFFFVKAYVTPNFKLHFKKDWIHFLPVAIEFVWSNYIKSQNFFWDGTRESLTWLGYWGYVVWMQYPTIYIICSGLIIYYCFKAENVLNHKKEDETIEIITDHTKWLYRVLKVTKFYALFILLVVMIDLIFFDYAFNRFYHYPLFTGLAIITYWLGIEGFSRKNQIGFKTKHVLSKKEKQQLTSIAHQLDVLMAQEKAYKNPDITLASLSKTLNTKPYLTTRSLNLILKKKFNDYINEYRIEEVKHLLKKPENKNYTLLAVAFEAGFNSKASFNRAVKKLTGKPPSALKTGK